MVRVKICYKNGREKGFFMTAGLKTDNLNASQFKQKETIFYGKLNGK